MCRPFIHSSQTDLNFGNLTQYLQWLTLKITNALHFSVNLLTETKSRIKWERNLTLYLCLVVIMRSFYENFLIKKEISTLTRIN